MFKGNLKRCCLIFLLCLAVGISAGAQSTSQGSIAGTVFDATGAVIPGATVTIHNNGTNAEIVLTANDSGYYKAPLLDPGIYTVTVKASNFTEYRASGVVVQISQTTDLEPKLSAGSESTVVEVTTSAPVINTETPDFSSNLNQRSIQDIPINIRRWSALAMTTPGVVSDVSGFGLVSVRGQSTLLNNVMIDGADDNDAYWSEERGRTREAYSTSESAVREFAVNTGVYSSEFGRATGAVINSVTKSGSNQFHGQLYFYDRQSNWGAYNDYTTVTLPTYTNGVPTGSVSGVHIKPEDLRKIYGGTVGGPIIKDKLFFIYTYDQHTRIFPFIGLPKSPGNFFTAADAALPGGETCNLYPGAPATPGNGYISGGTPSTIDQVACVLAAREGASSYATGAASYNSYLLGSNSLLNDEGQVSRAGYQEINTPKLDWQINSKNHASFLYHRLNWDSPGGVQTGTEGAYGLDSEGNDFVHVQYGVAKLNSQIASTVTNEVLYQYGREFLAETQQAYSAFEAANFTGSNGNVPFLPNVGGLTNGINLGSPYYAYRLAYPDERKWQIADTLYWSKGNHSFKFGGDVLHNWDETNALSGAAAAGGTSITASGNGAYYYPNIGNLFADIASEGKTGTCDSAQSATGSPTTSVVGNYQCYSGYAQAFGNAAFSITTLDWSAFAQDNWKVSPRLTLELGVRYDYEKLPPETAALVNPAIPQTTNLPSDKNNIGPRIGFAYDVFGTGKTVLHGGYGMYYGRIINSALLSARQNSGVTSGSQFTYASPFVPTPGSTVSPIFPNNVPSANGTIPTGVTPAAYYLDKDLQNPDAQEFDLILQQDLGRHTILSISYLGSIGQHEPNFLNLNLNPGVMQTATITVSDSSGAGPLKPGTYQVAQYEKATVPNAYFQPAYASVTEVTSNVNSNYNAFVAEIQNRSFKMIQYDFNYTWSHALDFAQNVATGVAPEGWQDPYNNPRLNYGNSDFNIPNRFTGYVLFNAPNFVRNGSALGYVINGWSLDNNFQMQNGIPYSPNLVQSVTTNQAMSTGNIFGTNGPTWIPAVIPGGGRNHFQQPRIIIDDAHLQKSFNFTDHYNLQVFVNVFNVANHQNVSVPSGSANGVSTTAYAVTASGTNTATLTYLSPLTATALGTLPFGAVLSTNSEGFLLTQRLIEIGGKFNF